MNPPQEQTPVPRSLLLLLGLTMAACATSGIEPETVFYPDPPQAPRIQFLYAIGRAADVEGEVSSLDKFLFGEDSMDNREISRPFGCAAFDGAFYITDTSFGAILKIDLQAKKIEVLELVGRGMVKKPMNLCFAPDGTVFVADVGRRQIVAYDRTFKFLKDYGPFGDQSRPVDVAVHGDRIYVADSGTKRVRVLDREDGKELLNLGKKTIDGEELRAPTSVAVDERGFIYVSDTVLCRVFIWNAKGEFVRHIGEPGDIVGQLARAKGIAVSGKTLFVLDAAFENCQIFDFAGNPLLFFGGPGNRPGSLYLPATIWVGTEGLEFFADRVDSDFVPEKLIMITSQFGPRKVSFYALGRSKQSKYEPSVLLDQPKQFSPAERAKIIEGRTAKQK
jgi:sugar lactone lactonase YvrE